MGPLQAAVRFEVSKPTVFFLSLPASILTLPVSIATFPVFFLRQSDPVYSSPSHLS